MDSQQANALVVIGNQLAKAFHQHHPGIVTRRTNVTSSQQTYQDGIEHGAKIRLHRTLTGQGNTNERKVIGG